VDVFGGYEATRVSSQAREIPANARSDPSPEALHWAWTCSALRKSASEQGFKPTPGLEPGTPSLRVKRVHGADSAISLQIARPVRRAESVEVRGSPQRSSDVFQRCSNSRPSGWGGLENRYPSLGGSRVRIPPPPLNQAVPDQGAASVRACAVSQTAALSLWKSEEGFRSPLVCRHEERRHRPLLPPSPREVGIENIDQPRPKSGSVIDSPASPWSWL
jgi:hypothetical protein